MSDTTMTELVIDDQIRGTRQELVKGDYTSEEDPDYTEREMRWTDTLEYNLNHRREEVREADRLVDQLIVRHAKQIGSGNLKRVCESLSEQLSGSTDWGQMRQADPQLDDVATRYEDLLASNEEGDIRVMVADIIRYKSDPEAYDDSSSEQLADLTRLVSTAT